MQYFTILWFPGCLEDSLELAVFLSLTNRIFYSVQDTLLGGTIGVHVFVKFDSSLEIVYSRIIHRFVHQDLGAGIFVDASQDLFKAILESVRLGNEIRFT